MYLKRKIDEYLKEWGASSDRKPLVVKGPRQVGKTESIRRFAKGNYDEVIEINFVEEPKYKMIISDGYNGTPSGFENICEDNNNITKPYVLHAEANAITKLARSSNNSDGATLYVTASPCIECAKLIIQAGIKRVVYGEEYRLKDGINLLKRANIEVIYLNTDKYGTE